MEKFKQRKINKEIKLLIIVFTIIFVILLIPVLFLGKNSPYITIINTKLLNNLSEDNRLEVKNYIKSEYINDYNDLIYNKLIEKYPDSIVDTLIKSKIKSYFDSNQVIIVFNEDKILNTQRTFKIAISYDEIKDYIKFSYDNTVANKYDYLLTEDQVSYISITYDDGPNGENTNELLALLKDYNYSSTFFVIANKIEKDSETIKNIYNSSSEVGYHSYAHKYLTKQKISEITDEFNKSDEIYYNITGDHFKLTRPPYGSYNEKVMNAIPTPFIRWNVDTNDWRYKDADYLSNYVLENVKAGDIVLFHDSYTTSIEASKKLYEQLYLKSYDVVSISRLAEINGITLENNNAYYSFN